MEIYIIDIWLSKLNYGWVKEIREALEKYNWLQNVTNWNYQTVGAKKLVSANAEIRKISETIPINSQNMQLYRMIQ